MKEKKYDLYFENSVKVKKLNDDYYHCYKDMERSLFRKNNILKTNILISELLDKMLEEQEKGISVDKNITKNKQLYIEQIEKKINYREKINLFKQSDLNKYEIAGILLTMCMYIVLLFVKELMRDSYLINYYVDLLVAVVMLTISIRQLMTQKQLINRYQISSMPFIIEVIAILLSLLIAFIMYKSPFDITFVILVVAFYASKKLYKKEVYK